MDDLIENIIKIILPRINENNNKKLELEVRFGYMSKDNNFRSDISENYWKKLLETFDKSTLKNVFIKNEIKIKDEYYDTYIMSTSNEITNIIKKDKLVNLNIKTNSLFDVRLSLSSENIIDDNLSEDINFIRYKNRYTYVYKNWNYDLTLIKQEKNNVNTIYYEFELELNNNNILMDKDTLKKYLKSTFSKIIDIFKILDSNNKNYIFKI